MLDQATLFLMVIHTSTVMVSAAIMARPNEMLSNTPVKAVHAQDMEVSALTVDVGAILVISVGKVHKLVSLDNRV
jgi:hypothetical protein